MLKAKIKKNTSPPWSDDEVKLLKRLFPRGEAREIAERIGRPLTAVRQKAYYMGITTNRSRLWSADEIRQLTTLYRRETQKSIANKLGRSLRSIEYQAR